MENNKKENKAESLRELRITILENSLLHESMITGLLADLLDIDEENSLTLGDKSSGLSLKSKLDLLIDLRAMTKDEQKKLICYLEIRNKFLHNWKCRSFSDCFRSIESTFKFLKKNYKPDGLWSEETQMTYCYNALGDDVVDIVVNKTGTKVISANAKRQVHAKSHEELREVNVKYMTKFAEIFSNPILAKYQISVEDQILLIRDFVINRSEQESRT